MFTYTRIVFGFLAAGAVIAHTAAQAADATRYVSVTGRNSNDCTLAAPCRSLNRAIQVVPDGGEIRVLDSGFYGNAAIRKSLTISGNGHTVHLNGPLTINEATAVVALRSLVLNGQGAVQDGIRIVAASAVHIERCVVHGFTRFGIGAEAENLHLFVTDTISRDNGADGLNTLPRSTLLTVDNSRFENNGQNGISVLNGRAIINRSVASGNAQAGIIAASAQSVTVTSTTATQNGLHGFFMLPGSTMAVISSVASDNGQAGLRVEGGSDARISESTFTRNQIGLSIAGLLETRVNNTIRGNGTDVVGTRTAISGL